MNATGTTPRSLRRFTKLTAVYVLFLVFAGAMVTSTDSGLAVPDWPLSYGMVFPPMKGGVFYEHGHRMIAAIAGFLTVVQAIWLQMRSPKILRRLGWATVGVVVAQGVLGGVTVLLKLPTWTSVSHAMLAEVYLCMHVAMAFLASDAAARWKAREKVEGGNRAARLAIIAFALISIQILLGAMTRHMGAGMAIPDFPLAFGQIVPAFTSAAIAIHYAHRVGALIVTVYLFLIFRPVLGSGKPASIRFYSLALALVAVQIALGAFTIWTARDPIIASLHLLGGASLLVATLLMAMALRTEPSRDPSSADDSATLPTEAMA